MSEGRGGETGRVDGEPVFTFVSKEKVRTVPPFSAEDRRLFHVRRPGRDSVWYWGEGSQRDIDVT